jgi:outer membrane protein OmpA-like peptidoglycan-associated protein
MRGNTFLHPALCIAALALAACTTPAPRSAPPAPLPSAPPPTLPAKVAVAPKIESPKGPVVLARPGFEDGKQRIKLTLAKNAADALTPGDVGYYVDVLQGRLKQVAGKQVGVVVGRQGDNVILDVSSRLDFEAGSARITPAIREMLAPIVKVLAEYRMMLVAVNASPDMTQEVAPDNRLADQRGLAVARDLAAAGVAPARIVVAGSSGARTSSEPLNLAEAHTQLEIHLEPIIHTVDTSHAAPPASR